MSILKGVLLDGTYVELVDIDLTGSTANLLYTQLVLVLVDGSAFSVGSAISGDSDNGNDGVGVVREKIDDNTVVVELSSGTFVAGNGVDDTTVYAADATTIDSVTKNIKIKRITANSGDEIIGVYV